MRLRETTLRGSGLRPPPGLARLRSLRRSTRGKNRGALQIVFASESGPVGMLFNKLSLFRFNERRLTCAWGNPAGSDGVHMNIVTGPFSCQVARKSDHAALAGTVSDRLELRRRANHSGNRKRTLIIFPRFCPIMTFPTACEHRNVPVRFVSRTLFHCSSRISSAGAPQEVPALLIKISIRPNRVSAASTTSPDARRIRGRRRRAPQSATPSAFNSSAALSQRSFFGGRRAPGLRPFPRGLPPSGAPAPWSHL